DSGPTTPDVRLDTTNDSGPTVPDVRLDTTNDSGPTTPDVQLETSAASREAAERAQERTQLEKLIAQSEARITAARELKELLHSDSGRSSNLSEDERKAAIAEYRKTLNIERPIERMPQGMQWTYLPELTMTLNRESGDLSRLRDELAALPSS
ncbi:MAG: hypothetical protein KDD69_14340, partial [Bdellovibrionales bacterium]|nr:hypothetical protein [Bdellovibrionales bacterium]